MKNIREVVKKMVMVKVDETLPLPQGLFQAAKQLLQR